MADRTSISSFFKSSIRGPFQRPAREQDSEANVGTYVLVSFNPNVSVPHLLPIYRDVFTHCLSLIVSEGKAPGFSVNMALGQSNADTSKTSYEMRRQQVRRAQKKHRAKKENYVLALEEEVQRLRRTVYTSQQHICALSDALSSHGISTPDSPVTLQPEFNMARVALVGSGPNSSLKVHKPDSNGHPPLASAANDVHDSNAVIQSPDRTLLMDIDISPQYCHRDYASPSAAVSPLVVSSSGDSAADYSGVEFVLALEHRCLHHTGHPSISNGMPGHAITLNAAALACAPEIIEPNEAWSMPTASLERLLELSNTLGLRPGTLTPTQAWHHVRSHPRFAQLTSEKFQTLVALLVKEVKCQGFGAAMSEKVLDTVLRRVF